MCLLKLNSTKQLNIQLGLVHMGILKHVPVWRLSFYTQGCAGVPCLDTVFILNLTSLWVPGCILSEFGHLHPHSCQFGSSCCFPIDKNGTTCTSLCGQTWPSHKRTLKYPGGGVAGLGPKYIYWSCLPNKKKFVFWSIQSWDLHTGEPG